MRVPVLVPTLATGLVLALGGCGSDDESTASTSATTSTAGGAATATTTSGGDSTAQSGSSIVGTGYRTTAPQGWTDVTDRLSGSAIRIDKGYAARPQNGFSSNVVIIRETPPAIRGKTIRDVEDPLLQQAADTLGVERPDVEDRFEIDGDDAVRWTLRREQGGRQLVQRQAAVVHDDALYTMTLTTLAEDDGSGQADLRTVLDGWQWD